MAALAADDIVPKLQVLETEVEMRYVGQEHAVALRLPDHELTQHDLPNLMKRFNVQHHRHCGHSMEDPVELLTLRQRATGRLPRTRIPIAKSDPTAASPNSYCGQEARDVIGVDLQPPIQASMFHLLPNSWRRTTAAGFFAWLALRVAGKVATPLSL